VNQYFEIAYSVSGTQGCGIYGVMLSELKWGSRRLVVLKTRHEFPKAAVKVIGYSGAEVAQHTGVTNSYITRIVTTRDVVSRVQKGNNCGEHLLHERRTTPYVSTSTGSSSLRAFPDIIDHYIVFLLTQISVPIVGFFYQIEFVC
jgi:hypothetical protein